MALVNGRYACSQMVRHSYLKGTSYVTQPVHTLSGVYVVASRHTTTTTSPPPYHNALQAGSNVHTTHAHT